MSIRSLSLISVGAVALLPLAAPHLAHTPMPVARAPAYTTASMISAPIKTAMRPLDLEVLTMADFGDTDSVR